MQKRYSKEGIVGLTGAFISLCCAAGPAAASYNVYYGHLHNHSTISDGSGTPAQAYAYARDTAGLDFFSLADHAEQISSTEWTTMKNTADAYNDDGNFVALWGFEWSSNSLYGHVTVTGTSDYCTANDSATDTFDELVNWLDSRNGLAFFNHPGREDDTGNEFNHFSSTPSDKFVGIELFNKTADFDTYYYNDGYYSNDGNKGFYQEALDRGWDIGAAGGDDNHSATWGTDTDYRLAVLATEKTRAGIMEALAARRMFSTLDKNLTLSFTINDQEMGSEVDAGSYNAVISAGDGDAETFTAVQLLKNGEVEQTWYPNQSNPVITHSLTVYGGEYYYVKVTQADGDEAISSPIFIVGAACTPTSVHVASVATSTVKDSGANYFGLATVNLEDNCFAKVADADVTGHFTGDFSSEPQMTETSDANGDAVFQTGSSAKKPSFGFLVDNVDADGLTYVP